MNVNDAELRAIVPVYNKIMGHVKEWLDHSQQLLDLHMTNMLIGAVFEEDIHLTERQKTLLQWAIHISLIRMWDLDDGTIPKQISDNHSIN